MDIVKTDSEVVSEAMMSTELLIRDCPAPTQRELRKLLAIQGYLLQKVGLDMLAESKQVRRGDNKVALALRALSASREALRSSAGVDVKEDEPPTEPVD